MTISRHGVDDFVEPRSDKKFETKDACKDECPLLFKAMHTTQNVDGNCKMPGTESRILVKLCSLSVGSSLQKLVYCPDIANVVLRLNKAAQRKAKLYPYTLNEYAL